MIYKYDLFRNKFSLKNTFKLSEIDWNILANSYKYPGYIKYKNKKVAESSKFYHTDRIQNIPQIPNYLQLRDYQSEAVVSWLKNMGRGTLKMATGSGKTIIALAIAVELYEKINLDALLIVCPFRHLVTQWERECHKFNLQPILAFENVHNWQTHLSSQLYNILNGDQSFLTVITTNSTLISIGFQSQLKFFPEKTLIVGDEAHNLGAQKLEQSLPRNIGLRLALSATPERYFDSDGTDSIFNYFGPILQPEFTLKDAIKKGALVPYFYYPIFVELTSSEAFSYAKLTKRIGWAFRQNNHNLEGNFNQNFRLEDNETLKSLLIQRSRLIAGAANKLNALKELMLPRKNTSHTLFYCGDGNQNDVGLNRQIAAVTRILGSELGYRVNTYTAKTPLKEREEIRQQFESGQLQGLIAIRCLDEGVDIPAIKNAVILASTTNPRQFIQRRGRILRPYPGKDFANLFDMIVMPPNLDRESLQVERNLASKELKRAIEFAKLADNSDEAMDKLLLLQNKFNLLE